MVELTEVQVDVLRWVADECPPREWPDYGHRISAKALQTRGLVRITGHGKTWTAQLTEDGHSYVTALAAPTDKSTTPDHSPLMARDAHAAEDLLDRLQATADQRLVIADPTAAARASYRSAINTAIIAGLVPDGKRLRHTGRDHGDMQIWLQDERASPGNPAPLPVPTSIGPLVRALASAGAFAVSEEAFPRVLLLMQTLADEAERRAYRLEDEDGACVFVIGEDHVPFVLFEEEETVERPPEDELQSAKYDWQRIRPRRMTVSTGRLRFELRIPNRWQQHWWADRKRWSLDDKLPEVFSAVEAEAGAMRDVRERKVREAEDRRRRWEEAVPRARLAYVEEFNQERLAQQLTGMRKARETREYAESLTDTDWRAWILAEADRLDPLKHPDILEYVEPKTFPREEVDKYMPQGMTSAHPPADDTSRW